MRFSQWSIRPIGCRDTILVFLGTNLGVSHVSFACESGWKIGKYL